MRSTAYILVAAAAFSAAACVEENPDRQGRDSADGWLLPWSPADASVDWRVPGDWKVTRQDSKRTAEASAAGDSKPAKDTGDPDATAPPMDSVVPKPDTLACPPDAFLKCTTTTQLLRCNSSGTGTTVVDCSPYQCNPAEKRCNECGLGSAPYCQGDDLVSCSPKGMPVVQACPDGCQGGACLSCTPSPFYSDADKDGYGDPNNKVEACSKPFGFVSNKLDCDDLDPLVYPGQSGYFTSPTKGSGKYDYNCNGTEERQHLSLVNCVKSGMTCIGNGWSGTVPACGNAGVFITCVKVSKPQMSCAESPSSLTQSCR